MSGKIILIVTVLWINVAAAQNREPPAPITGEKSDSIQITEYPKDGQEYQRNVLESNLRDTRTYDWIRYSKLTCNSGPTETCSGTVVVDSPAGWQACRALYQISKSANGASYSVSPTSWYSNDPESPDRFRSYSFYLRSTGEGPFGGGTHMDFINVGIRLLPASSTNADRYVAGCEIPYHD